MRSANSAIRISQATLRLQRACAGRRGAFATATAVSHPDGKLIVYHLPRRNVLLARWRSVTSQASSSPPCDYEPSNAVPSRYGYDRVASVPARNPYTVIVKLARPYSPIIVLFRGRRPTVEILPAHLLARYASLDRMLAAPTGSGTTVHFAYSGPAVIGWAVKSALNYGGRPAIAQSTIRFVHDQSTTINQLLTRRSMPLPPTFRNRSISNCPSVPSGVAAPFLILPR